MKKIRVEIDGRQVEGVAVNSKGTLWLHLDGETFAVESETKKSRRGGRSASAASNPGEILAPMPGKIIKINAQVGDSVVAQQVLLVMEAMKMEYTLKAQADGKVASLTCEPGQQVALGQNLMKLEIKS